MLIVAAYIALNIIVMILVFIHPILGLLAWLLALGIAIYVGLAAPGDYYRHVVLKEDFWI